MLKTIILLLTLAITTSSFEQEAKNIRLIHIGEETKPVGTLLISIYRNIQPADRSADRLYGRGIKTTKKTFRMIERFMEGCSYLTKKPLEKDSLEYEIIDSGGSKTYLLTSNSSNFFDNLRAYIRTNRLDNHVLEALANYH